MEKFLLAPHPFKVAAITGIFSLLPGFENEVRILKQIQIEMILNRGEISQFSSENLLSIFYILKNVMSEEDLSRDFNFKNITETFEKDYFSKLSLIQEREPSLSMVREPSLSMVREPPLSMERKRETSPSSNSSERKRGRELSLSEEECFSSSEDRCASPERKRCCTQQKVCRFGYSCPTVIFETFSPSLFPNHFKRKVCCKEHSQPPTEYFKYTMCRDFFCKRKKCSHFHTPIKCDFCPIHCDNDDHRCAFCLGAEKGE